MTDVGDVDQRAHNIAALEKLVAEIIERKESVLPRRPIVIEFCGSPKAGKTSCINALAMFLKRNDIRTTVITERGAICPIYDKFDPNFNIWAGCSELARFAEIMSNHYKDFDVVIMDRGFFDAVCWFHYQMNLLKLDQDSYQRFVSFFLARKWTSNIHILYIFKAGAQTSLQREHANLLTNKHGRIMQPEVLEQFNVAIDKCVELYKVYFGKKLHIIDTGGKTQEQVSFSVTSDILNLLNDVIKERIAYFDKRWLDDASEVFLPNLIFDRLAQFSYGERSYVESDSSIVQPIPVAVITDHECEHVVVAKKLISATPQNSPERERSLVYFGGHIREEDESNQMGVSGLASVANAALTRELKEELDINFVGNDKPKFCIWDRRNERSEKHVAFVYHVRVNRQSLRIVADRKEFAEKEAYMVNVRELGEKHPNFERWSEIIFTKLLGKDI